MANFDSTENVQNDLAELRRLRIALPMAGRGSAHRELTIQLIRQLLKRVELAIKSDRVTADAELERKSIQDWFDDTLAERGFGEMNLDLPTIG
jgi:hypothetical protein